MATLKMHLRNNVNDIMVVGSGVDRWADLSGNNNDATQSTDSLRPPVTVVDGVSRVSFQGSQYLQFPAIPNLYVTDMTVVIVAQFDRTIVANEVFFSLRVTHDVNGGNANVNWFGINNDPDRAVDDDEAVSFKFRGNVSDIQYAESLLTLVARGGDGVAEQWVGPEYFSGGEIHNNAIVNDAAATNAIGATATGVNFAKFDLYEVRVYDGQLTDEEIRDLQDELSIHHGSLSRNEGRYFIVEGDSLTAAGAAPNEAYWEQLARMYRTEPKIQRVAVAGRELSNMDAYAVTRVDAEIALHADYPYKYAFLWGGTNDIEASSANLTLLQGWATSWISGRKAAGAVTVILTMIPRNWNTPSPDEATRVAFNDWILAGGSGADIIVDLTGSVPFDSSTGYTNLTYYDPDEIHLVAAGHEVIAQQAKLALDAYEGNLIVEPEGRHSIRGSLYSDLGTYRVNLPSDASTPQLVRVRNTSGRGQTIKARADGGVFVPVESETDMILRVPAGSEAYLEVKTAGPVYRDALRQQSERPYTFEVSMAG